MPRRRARWSTCSLPTAAATPTSPPSTTASVLTYRALQAEVAASPRGWPRAGIGPGDRVGVRIASGHATSSTSPSSPCCTPGRPTCRSTPTTPTSGPRSSSARPASTRARATASTIDRRRPPGAAGVACPASTTTPGSSSPPARPGCPRAWPSRHRSRPPSSTPRPSCSRVDDPIGPGDRVLAGLSVAFDASRARRCGWRGATAPAWCRRPGRSCARGMDLGPWLVAQRHHGRVDRADPGRRCGPPRRSTRCGSSSSAARPARRALVARVVGARAGGVEHLRPDRGDRRRLRRAAGRRRAGAHRAARSTAGTSPWSTPTGAPVADGRDRRADHRRRRPGPLPRPGEGRRAVRADADARLGPRLPQRRPRGSTTPTGLLFVGPRRRPGEARRPAHRARRGRRRAAGAARRSPAAAAAVQHDRGRQPGARRLPRRRRPRLRPRPPPGAARRSCRPRSCPLLAVVDELPTRTSGKVDRAALPWPLPGATPGPTPASGPRHRRPGWPSGGREVLGAAVGGPDDDFFELGGGSLAAAQLVSALRRRYPAGRRSPTSTPTPASVRMAERLDELAASASRRPDPEARDAGAPTPRRTQLLLTVLTLACRRSSGLRWLVWLLTLTDLLDRAPATPWVADRCRGGGSRLGWLVLHHPARPDGRSPSLGARLLLRRRATRRPTRGAAASTCGSGRPRS